MKSKRAINIIVVSIGVAALAFLIYKVGLTELLENLLAIGPAFPLIVALSALSNTGACAGWYYAIERAHRPRFRRLLGISFASLSVAGALPTGQAGEVAKGNLLRGLAPGTEILSSLLIYNYLHVLVTIGMTLIGPIAALTAGDQFAREVSWATLGVCGAVLAGTLLLGLLLYWGILHRVLERIRKLPLFWKPSERLLGGVREVDSKLRGVIAARPGDLLKSMLGLAVGRLLLIAEIYAILAYMDVSYSITVSLMVFSTTAVANYLLMVLPAREGFLEGSTYVVFRMLGLSGAHGLSLEITRRLRKIVFQALGVVLMMYFARRREETDLPAGDDPGDGTGEGDG